MKTTSIVLSILFFALTLIGCDNNNPITSCGNNSSNETLLFSKDSIGLSTTESGQLGLMRAFNVGINAKKIRVEFEGYTNLLTDSSNIRTLYLSCQAHYQNFYSLNLALSDDINRHQSLIINNPDTSKFNLNFICNIDYANPVEIQQNGIGIIQFGNIKVYSVN